MDPSYTGQGERPATGANLDAYYRATPREKLKKEAKAFMQAQGVYVPTRWVKRWDETVAMYLAYHVSHLGTQKDPHGWMFNSVRELEERTGITRRKQERSREVLAKARVIEVKQAGIGNKWNVRVNIELLKLMDELPSYKEAVATVEEPTEQESLAPNRQKDCTKRTNLLHETAKPKTATRSRIRRRTLQ